MEKEYVTAQQEEADSSKNKTISKFIIDYSSVSISRKWKDIKIDFLLLVVSLIMLMSNSIG